jgi:cytidine deaminase
VTDFTSDEKKLIEHAKKAIVKYNKQRKAKGGIDTLYAFVMSKDGGIYDGACFETTISNSNICGERHAIANMVLKETYNTKVKHIAVAEPVPKVQKNSNTPCGTCRHVIWELGTPDTTVICIQYIQQKDGWIFPKMEKHTIKELYPHPYTPIEWGR